MPLFHWLLAKRKEKFPSIESRSFGIQWQAVGVYCCVSVVRFNFVLFLEAQLEDLQQLQMAAKRSLFIPLFIPLFIHSFLYSFIHSLFIRYSFFIHSLFIRYSFVCKSKKDFFHNSVILKDKNPKIVFNEQIQRQNNKFNNYKFNHLQIYRTIWVPNIDKTTWNRKPQTRFKRTFHSYIWRTTICESFWQMFEQIERNRKSGSNYFRVISLVQLCHYQLDVHDIYLRVKANMLKSQSWRSHSRFLLRYKLDIAEYRINKRDENRQMYVQSGLYSFHLAEQ